jgi:hypothetical protein
MTKLTDEEDADLWVDLSPSVAALPAQLKSINALALPGYGAYRFRCVVDFASIRVGLSKASNFNTVNRIVGARYSEGLDQGPGKAARHFVIRFDDPESRASILAKLEPLRKHAGGFTMEPALEKIEVALDGYSRAQCRSELLVMTERFFRFGSELCSDNMRLTRRLGEVEWAENSALFARLLNSGYTIFVGNTEEPITQRIYLKVTDQSGQVKLPAAEQRARREVTLQGATLADPKSGFPSLDLAGNEPWKFEALSKWFRFRKLKADLQEEPQQAYWLNRRVLQGVRNPLRPDRRVFDHRTVSDKVLNELARDQLRELSRRFSSK